jgi:hypothetical protein
MPHRHITSVVWLSLALLTFGFAPRALAQHTDHPAPRDTGRKATPAKKPATAPARRPAARPSSDKTDPATRPRRRAAAPARTAPTAQDSARHRTHSDSLHRAMMSDSAHRRLMMDSAHRAMMADSAHGRMQHDTAGHAMPADTTHSPDAHAGMAQPGAATDTAHAAMQHGMMTGPLGISMDRLGSGTTWIPDAAPLPSRHFMAGDWSMMLHGFLFLQYIDQGGPRGDSQFGSVNWAMLMASRDLAGGMFTFRVMPSLDPATIGRCGYPLLLQSGETCHGVALVDRQHPHDFWMELAAQYEREITDDVALSLYAAPAGEPALGSVAFMHRPSAMDDLMAPLGHHWNDATHISFGVLTAGLFTRNVRLEGSIFNGREPDESRWNFDRIKLDSYSGRITLNPSANWSFTAGYGFMKSPEILHPDESMRRFVASALHGRRFAAEGQWATSFVLGANRHGDGDHGWTKALLAETELVLDRSNTVFARAERVEKNAEELQVPGLPGNDVFNVNALSLGYIREISRTRPLTIGVGMRGNVGFVPSELETAYGSRTPAGFAVFIRLRPRSARINAAGEHSMPMSR